MALAANTQVNASTDLVTIVCGVCGGIYAIAERYRYIKQEQGGFWKCPYCQNLWGYGTSENERLKQQLVKKEREVKQERKRKEWAQQETRVTEYRCRELKGRLSKIKKRVGNGVCPCCNRSFNDLRRHMNIKHPSYAKTDEA